MISMKEIRAKAEREAKEQIAHLRKRNEQLSGKVLSLEARLGEQAEIRRAIENAVVAAEPFKRVPWVETKHAGRPVDFAMQLSDWHTGSKIRANQTEGINAFSWTIQQNRINFLIEKMLEYVSTQRHSYRIDRVHILGLEDWVSGGIHQELLVNNEFPEPVQAVNAGLLLGETILKICAHFPEVIFVGVGAGNHDRLTMKVQFKNAAKNSWSYVVYAVAKAYCKNVKNLEFMQPEGMKAIHKIAEHLFLLEHGHSIRGWAGTPWYGMARLKGKESLKRMRLMLEEWRNFKTSTKREFGFDYWAFGHFHVSNFLEGDTIVNSSLSGTDEFDHMQGRYGRPGQNAFLVHPKWGLFNFVPFQAV